MVIIDASHDLPRARPTAVLDDVAELPTADQREREAGARLEALLAGEEGTRHGTGTSPGGPG
jgi:hypothetical protein